MSQRIQKLNELLRQEISNLLLREVDFGNTLVTITKVEASPDLRQARIKISVMPTEQNERVLHILERNIFHLQQLLNKKLTMKIVPKIKFEIDKAEIKAQQIEKLLQEIKGG